MPEIVTPETAVAPVQTSVPDGDLRMIPISQLHESPLNPRKHFEEKPMEELIRSVRETGIWTPLIVRPLLPADVQEHVSMDRGFEVGAGHRRLKAAVAAGLAEVPCIVRQLSDEAFLDVLCFDNCGRADLHPLEEAAGFALNMEKNGRDRLALAKHLGISESQVHARLKLLELTDEARTAFWSGLITAGHADIIARLQPKEQLEAIAFCQPQDWNPGRRVSVLELRQWVRQKVHVELQKAPFDKDAADLFSRAGACSACPKRSASNPELYAEAEGLDVCTDPACYHEKLKAHLIIVREQLARKGEFVEVSEGYQRPKKDGPLPHSDWHEAAKGEEKQAKPALVVDGYGVGRVINVVTHQRKAEDSPAVQKAQREADDSKRKAKVDRERAVRRKILDAVCDKVGGLTRADVEAALIAFFENDMDGLAAELLCDWHGIPHGEYDADRHLFAAMPKMPEPEFCRLVVEAGVSSDFDEWKIGRNEKPEALLALAKRYKVDAAKIRLQVEEHLKSQEGGTRKEVASKLPTLADQAKKAPAKKSPAKKAPAKKTAKKGGRK